MRRIMRQILKLCKNEHVLTKRDSRVIDNLSNSQNITFLCFVFSHLIDKRHGSQILPQTIWLGNHTSHTKVYFNEFVANVQRDNIGIVIFDLRGHGGCQRPKTPLRGQKKHEGVDLLKKYLIKVSEQPQKPLSGCNQIRPTASGKKNYDF